MKSTHFIFIFLNVLLFCTTVLVCGCEEKYGQYLGKKSQFVTKRPALLQSLTAMAWNRDLNLCWEFSLSCVHERQTVPVRTAAMLHSRTAKDRTKWRKQARWICLRSPSILSPLACRKESKHISHDYLKCRRHCTRYQDKDQNK